MNAYCLLPLLPLDFLPERLLRLRDLVDAVVDRSQVREFGSKSANFRRSFSNFLTVDDLSPSVSPLPTDRAVKDSSSRCSDALRDRRGSVRIQNHLSNAIPSIRIMSVDNDRAVCSMPFMFPISATFFPYTLSVDRVSHAGPRGNWL